MSIGHTKAPLIYVGGGKGGVGKSLLSMAIVDYLDTRFHPLLFVETERGNAEIPKAYPHIPMFAVDLNIKLGWIELINACAEASPDQYVVINSAGGAIEGVRDFGQLLAGSLEELGRELIVLWPINRQRPSLEFMAQFRAVLPSVNVHVVVNEHYGRPEDFELYNGWRIKHGRDLVDLGLCFSGLADRVADELIVKHMTIADAGRDMPIGNRAELLRWKGDVADMLARVIP